MQLPAFLRAALLSLIIVSLAGCGAPRPPVEFGRLERAIDATVAVIGEREPGAQLRVSPVSGLPELLVEERRPLAGAGVVLDDGFVLTSAHLVDGAARTLVRLPGADSPPLEAELVGVSLCDDLALLRLPESAPQPARIARDARPALGTPVYALGFAPGGAVASPTFSEGVVTWLESTGAGESRGALFTTSAALLAGGSGGPLIDANGAVVGIVTEGRYSAPVDGADYVIRIDYAQRVADELREGGAMLSLGLDVTEAGANASELLRFFGPEAAGGGLFVAGAAPWATSLRPGDLLIAVAGTPVTTISDLCGALRAYDGPWPAPAAVLRREGETAVRVETALPQDGGTAPAIQATPPESEPTPLALTDPTPSPATPAPSPIAAPAFAVQDLSAETLQAARAAAAAERALHSELFFETFDSEATKRRWRPTDEASGARQLIYSYYQLTLKTPGAIIGDVWPERPLGARYIVELDVALPTSGSTAAGIAFDQQTDGSGLSYFVLGADGAWQLATFQGGALVPGRYVRGVSPAFVAGGGTNQLRVVRLAEGTEFWLNDSLVARAAPGPFGGGHAGVIAIAGPEPLPQPVAVIVDNFRLLERS